MSAQELQVKEKQTLATPAEQTRPGIVFTPVVDIKENDHEIILLADMPGVNPDDLNIDLNDSMLTISGDVKPWHDVEEQDVLVEFQIGKYYRQFSLSEAIDQEKIQANLEYGVLRLVMPKAAKAMPRKITVNAG